VDQWFLTASPSYGNLLETQILTLPSQTSGLEILAWGLSNLCFNKPLGDSDAHLSLSTALDNEMMGEFYFFFYFFIFYLI